MTFAGDAHELVFHPSSQLASSTVQRGTNGQVGIPVCIYIYMTYGMTALISVLYQLYIHSVTGFPIPHIDT